MSNEWSNFDLNDNILNNLENELKFESPTEIQSRVLTYLNSKVDLVIQAKTGEGKTLCYALPILNYILNFYERAEDKIGEIAPVALILVPTRELGLQVNEHICKVLKDLSEEKKHYFNIRLANVLGGFAKPKQIKILSKFKPEIIIATPGRLWEIMENEECPLFTKFYKLRFLVLDEADRMTEKGHFRELKKIFTFIYNKLETVDLRQVPDENNPSVKEKVRNLMKGKKDEDEMENKILKNVLKKKGVKVDLDDIETVDMMEMFADEEMIDNFNFEEGKVEEEEGIEDIEEEEEGIEGIEGMEPEDTEDPQNEEEEEILDRSKLKKMKKAEEKIEDDQTPKHLINLRTILCSATIESLYKKQPKRNKKSKKPQPEEEESKVDLSNLVKNLKFYNKLIYVRNTANIEDSTETPEEASETKSNVLPEKLELDCYKCDSTIKDYYLLHILKEYQGKSIIVFTNSISHTKKIYSIFSFFDFKLTVLHSKMQQSQRIKNLDKFRKKESNILFCTDVGARGLDISLVDIVIQYHIPKSTEMFIHRSGRTARAAKEGICISLISEAELTLYKKIMRDIKVHEFGMKTLNVMQLEKYKSLFEFTKKVEKEDHSLKKKRREKQWFERSAGQCEMMFEDEEEDSENEDTRREQFLTKKRKQIQKEKFEDKKVFHAITSNNIKRTSFLTPDLVSKLNQMMNYGNIKDLNLTQAIYEANNDAQAFRHKGKQEKKRYRRRRGGK